MSRFLWLEIRDDYRTLIGDDEHENGAKDHGVEVYPPNLILK